ncbi:MAG: hypothetical protein WCL01_05765 [Comamonadaceae bacterium]
MAKIGLIDVPPSLQREFASLTSYTQKHGNAGNVLTLNRSVGSAETDAPAKPLAALATQAATWLRDQWKPYTPSQFYTDRRQEVIDATFDPVYWHECTVLSDQTAYSTPVVGIYNGSTNPQYFDSLRQPTRSKWTNAARKYPTPSDDGTELNPAPGWFGQVLDGKFRDSSLAQRHVNFLLPVTFIRNDPRPLALLFTGSISASSSFRGNSAWFQLSSNKQCLSPSINPGLTFFKPMGNWYKYDTRPLNLQGDNPSGWEHTETVSLVRNARSKLKGAFEGWETTLLVKIIIPPSNGYLFSRNDSILVRHRVNARLFLGLGPNG